MPLPLPTLDDRRFQDLVDEGRALIPVLAPEWTDHNVHDPGITLIELFAWIAETDIYRLDRIPEHRRRAFLALVGVEPRPPEGATTPVAFELEDGAGTTVLPSGLDLEGHDLAGHAVRFRTRRSVVAVPGRLEALFASTGDQVNDLTSRWRRGETLALLGADPRPGSSFYLGLRLPSGPPTTPLSLYFELPAMEPAGAEGDERRRLVEQNRLALEPCRTALPCESCPGDGEIAGREERDHDREILVHHSARLVWEVHTGAGWQALDGKAARDTTRGFTLSGEVEIRIPANATPQRLGEVDEPLFYLRRRLLSGQLDAAPEVSSVLLNGVATRQQERIEDEAVAIGDGSPSQRARLAHPLVCADRLEITTQESGGAQLWSPRADFLASGRSDAHFGLDRGTGELLFGDGERGRCVPEGAAITASYGSTLGAAGNLEAGSLERLADSVHNRGLLAELGLDFEATVGAIDAVHQPLDAAGGSSGETLDEAASRAFELVRSSPRAVTLQDFETRALETPGAQLARVAARADLHPAFPCFQAPGVITVLIVPRLPARRPMPSRGLRRLVAAYLAPRRPLGSRVEVVGPTWVEVSVRATVRACRGIDPGQLEGRLVEAIDRFFDPLSGGPKGQGRGGQKDVGWPFGRDVYRSEVLQVLDETAGSDHVLALELLDRHGKPSCGNFCLPPSGLVAAGRHQITVLRAES